MTILTDWQIKKNINNGFMVVTPYDVELVNPASLDIRFGNKFITTKSRERINLGDRGLYPAIDPLNKDTFYSETIERDEYWLAPGENIMISMMEDITLPINISAKLFGKSSLARLGLMNSPDACWVDPGWSGVLVQELFNASRSAIKISYGMKAGQLVFFEHQNAENPYSKTGRYYKQTNFGSLGVD